VEVALEGVAPGVRVAPHREQVVRELVARRGPVLVAAPPESLGIPETAAVAAVELEAGYRRSTKSRTDAEISLR
jgi:hypothetical protein